MKKEGQFGIHEAVALTTIAMLSKILYTSPSTAVKEAGSASWYMTIISCIITLIFFLIICKLLERFPGKNLFEIYEAVLGKVIGKLLTVLYSAFLIFYSASAIREFVEMIKTYTLPETAPSVIIGTMLAVSALICYKGIENFARISYVIFYPVLLGLVIILVLACKDYKFDYLKPYLGYGFSKTLIVGFLRSSAYQEVNSLSVITKSMHSFKEVKKAGIISILLTGTVFSMTMLCYLMVYGYAVGQENVSGLYQISRLIYYNRYFQRVEAIFLFIWVAASIQNSSLSLYFAISSYSTAFKIREYRNLILPFCFLTFTVSLLPNNFSEVVNINMKIIREYSFPFPYIIPILLLIISSLFRKGNYKTGVRK